jgi:5-methylcytosine-specific restriction endonuclease McrA
VRRPSNRRYCTKECRAVDERARISARIMGLYRTAIDNLDIPKASMWQHKLVAYLADRDGKRCAICRKTINITLSSGPRGNPLGASIDHVIPRSRGGSDDLANLRLAHWKCNNQRGNRGGDEQLRLVG